MKTLMITGSRGWKDEECIRRVLKKQMRNGYDHLVVGDDRGANDIAKREALLLGMDVTVYCANWTRNGPAAGPLRNLRMLNQKPGCVMAFWDERSPGTAHAIETARERHMQVYVFVEPREDAAR